MLMFDGCCGTKGASASMLDHGWEVITLDIDLAFLPDIVCDIREYSYSGPKPTLMWFSPPCTDFSFNDKPWNKDKQRPIDLSIYEACLRIVKETNPDFWIIENVRGAIKYFGPPKAKRGPFYLWGYFPPLAPFKLNYKRKDSYSGRNPELRAAIPYELSDQVRLAIERNPYW